jgi:hypothetical protein
MVNQLSGVRPSVLDSRSAISELMPLLPFNIRFKVDGATASFAASCLPVISKGSR